MNLLAFLTKENIIFFVIYGLITLIVLLVIIIGIVSIVRFFVKMFKSTFQKTEGLVNKGENLNVVVKELDKNIQERARVARGAKLSEGIPATGFKQSREEVIKKLFFRLINGKKRRKRMVQLD